jgi:hypothetical protein
MYYMRIFETVQLTVVVFVLIEMLSIVNIVFGILFSTFFRKSKTAGK